MLILLTAKTEVTVDLRIQNCQHNNYTFFCSLTHSHLANNYKCAVINGQLENTKSGNRNGNGNGNGNGKGRQRSIKVAAVQ